MPHQFEHRLTRIINQQLLPLLAQNRMGLEREALRYLPEEGTLAPTPHPAALGSALTHPLITTDYSEALLEFVTPAFPTISQALESLDEIHRYTVSQLCLLGDERLWSCSMPCVLNGEAGIPIAQFGSSNAGKLKHLYRVGLGWRYGKVMQAIAGIHFNFSFQEEGWQAIAAADQQSRITTIYQNQRYFDLMRNVQRTGWIIPYLFGASPAVCRSFFADQSSDLPTLDQYTSYLPYGTSLRLSDLGYSNRKCDDQGFEISSNSLDEYLRNLAFAMTKPCSCFEKIGIKVAGEYRQMNANYLQIENEYYASIRPKQVLSGEERPMHALHQRGVGYVELRSLDISPFSPQGVSEEQLQFARMWMIGCMLQPSAPLRSEDKAECDQNMLKVATQGRLPGLQLQRQKQAIALKQWGYEILDQLVGIAEILDQQEAQPVYVPLLTTLQQRVNQPELTPSAVILRELQQEQIPFGIFAKQQTARHWEDFCSRPLPLDKQQMFVELAEESLLEQQRLEASDCISFDAYLANFLRI